MTPNKSIISLCLYLPESSTSCYYWVLALAINSNRDKILGGSIIFFSHDREYIFAACILISFHPPNDSFIHHYYSSLYIYMYIIYNLPHSSQYILYIYLKFSTFGGGFKKKSSALKCTRLYDKRIVFKSRKRTN